jgi:hypothetical protein
MLSEIEYCSSANLPEFASRVRCRVAQQRTPIPYREDDSGSLPFRTGACGSGALISAHLLPDHPSRLPPDEWYPCDLAAQTHPVIVPTNTRAQASTIPSIHDFMSASPPGYPVLDELPAISIPGAQQKMHRDWLNHKCGGRVCFEVESSAVQIRIATFSECFCPGTH